MAGLVGTLTFVVLLILDALLVRSWLERSRAACADVIPYRSIAYISYGPDHSQRFFRR
jgi:hypothetical protein